MAYFITGTDTNVGKTLVSSWLCLHSGFDYFKPIQSGTTEGYDSHTVRQFSGALAYPEIYSLKAPLSPHLAAQLENKTINIEDIRLPSTSKLIVEGAGGVLVPLNDQYLMIDLMVRLNLPVIIVSRTTLGTINHTLLTIQALRQRNLVIAGIIMSGNDNPDNRQAIEDYGQAPVLATLPQLKEITSEALKSVPLPAKLKNLF